MKPSFESLPSAPALTYQFVEKTAATTSSWPAATAAGAVYEYDCPETNDPSGSMYPSRLRPQPSDFAIVTEAPGSTALVSVSAPSTVTLPDPTSTARAIADGRWYAPAVGQPSTKQSGLPILSRFAYFQ